VLMPKLVFISKDLENQAYELLLEKTTVGRGNFNTLVLADHSVSLTHCEILMNGTEIIIRDLDSSNGTFIDVVRLNKQAQAKNGQVIRFGMVKARLELEFPTDMNTHTKITAVYDLAKFQRKQRQTAKNSKPAHHDSTSEPHPR
jgi:pSer/pThr/pTyr-binding forkhead associated (FHA) protein